jgi:hypothetical protein
MLDREPLARESFDYMTDHLAEKAAGYIAEHKDQPFFLYLAFNATHGPNHATEADLAKAGGNRIKAMTLALDRAVGRVLDALDANGLAGNTLVFFLNDNGGAAGHDNAPLRGHKGSSWEGGIRIPFLARWPGTIPAGQVCDAPVIGLDLFPPGHGSRVCGGGGRPAHQTAQARAAGGDAIRRVADQSGGFRQHQADHRADHGHDPWRGLTHGSG